jgi:hypothetical protein
VVAANTLIAAASSIAINRRAWQGGVVALAHAGCETKVVNLGLAFLWSGRVLDRNTRPAANGGVETGPRSGSWDSMPQTQGL